MITSDLRRGRRSVASTVRCGMTGSGTVGLSELLLRSSLLRIAFGLAPPHAATTATAWACAGEARETATTTTSKATAAETSDARIAAALADGDTTTAWR